MGLDGSNDIINETTNLLGEKYLNKGNKATSTSLTSPVISKKSEGVHSKITNSIWFNPGQTICYSWQLFIPSTYSEVLFWFILCDPFGEIAANSTVSNEGAFLIFTSHHGAVYAQEYTLNLAIPTFTLVVESYGEPDGTFNLNLTISLPTHPVPLGSWTLSAKVLMPTMISLLSITETFILISSAEFEINHILVHTDYTTPIWTNLSELSPKQISPSDRLIVTGILQDPDTKVPLPVNTTPLYTCIKLSMSGEIRIDGEFYNKSIHPLPELEASPPDLLVFNITLPSRHFRGNITLTPIMAVGIHAIADPFNNNFFQGLPSLSIHCDYQVVGQTQIDPPSVIQVGNRFRTSIALTAVRICNDSVPVQTPFKIPDTLIQLLFDNGIFNRSRPLSWNEVGFNVLEVDNQHFGWNTITPYYYPTGRYFLQVKWDSTEAVKRIDIPLVPLCHSFILEESLSFEVYLHNNSGDYSVRVLNITIPDEGTVSIRVNILYMPAGIIASPTRTFWVGISETQRWIPYASTGTAWEVEIPTESVPHTSGESFTLWAWVRLSNGTINKLAQSVDVFVQIKEESTRSNGISSFTIEVTICTLCVVLSQKERKK